MFYSRHISAKYTWNSCCTLTVEQQWNGVACLENKTVIKGYRKLQTNAYRFVRKIRLHFFSSLIWFRLWQPVYRCIPVNSASEILYMSLKKSHKYQSEKQSKKNFIAKIGLTIVTSFTSSTSKGVAVYPKTLGSGSRSKPAVQLAAQ